MNGMVPGKENISPVAINQQLYAVQRISYCKIMFNIAY